MNKQDRSKSHTSRPKKATTKPKGTRKQTKRAITRDQFHSLVRKAAQPIRKPKSK